MAKTQYSFSDDASLLGAPTGFTITVRNLKVSAGAGFLVALTGDIMPAEQWDECQTGDLLFFGNAPGKVSHVALYLNDGKYIHSSGQVKINSIDARDTDYYAIPLLGISRIVNKIGTPGITAVKRHPWYFEQK